MLSDSCFYNNVRNEGADQLSNAIKFMSYEELFRVLIWLVFPQVAE